MFEKSQFYTNLRNISKNLDFIKNFEDCLLYSKLSRNIDFRPKFRKILIWVKLFEKSRIEPKFYFFLEILKFVILWKFPTISILIKKFSQSFVSSQIFYKQSRS